MTLVRRHCIYCDPETWQQLRRRARKAKMSLSRFGVLCCLKTDEDGTAETVRPSGHALAIMKWIGFIRKDDEPDLAGAAEAKVVAAAGPGRARVPATCPKCSQPSLIHQEGCAMCTSCGYSKCA